MFFPNCVNNLPGILFLKSQCGLLFYKGLLHIFQLFHDKILDEYFRLDQIEFYC